MNIVCAGYLVRYPLWGALWHHLQYIVGFERMGHTVVFVEHYGWPNSCFDVDAMTMTSDPSCGLRRLVGAWKALGLQCSWCYLAEDGTTHGLTRDQLASACVDADLYVDLSGINDIPEQRRARLSILVDTDPVFTQIGAHGLHRPFAEYSRLFTYAENIHRNSTMPTGGHRWLPTRQPAVADLWRVAPPNSDGRLTTVMNWTAYGEHEHGGVAYGQKDRQLMEVATLPGRCDRKFEVAVDVPEDIAGVLEGNGWLISSPLAATSTPGRYRKFIARSFGEFSVAKHGYVATRSGWFSDRSTGYLASGRPVILQDTGYSDNLPTGDGLLAFRTANEAVLAVRALERDYEHHCRAARQIAEAEFDHRKVLGDLLERSL